MSWQAWLTLAVVALTTVALARDWLAPSSTVLGGVIVLLVAGVLTPGQAFGGFSNPAPITVAALYVLARAVEKTGALQPLIGATLGSGGGDRRTLARLLTPVAGASAFLNNTPLVAALAPQVTDWADRRGLSPSRFLMPLSFATILGGVITLIGTSTNIVVSGLMEADGQAAIGMFELTRIGLPVALVGLAVVIALAPIVLPERRPARGDLRDNVREFMVHMVVASGGPLDGQAVEAGGLRHLQGVFLVQVDRGELSIAPVTPTTVLRGGDLLTFVGRADLIVDLQNMRGLASAEEKHMAELDTVRHTFFEAVVGADSPLIGKTLREAEFRSRYLAAVLAIHRAGQRVQAKLGTVRLRVGDTLLLLSDPGFRDRWRDRNDFLLVARFGGSPPAATRKAGIVGLVALGIVVVAGAGLLPTLHASLVGAVALVASGVMTAGEARSSVDLEVVIVIAGAFGLAAAIEHSGLAAHLAGGIVAASSELGERGVLLGVILATIAITEIITNNAAAVLVFPLAMSAAQTLGADPRPFAIAVAIGASASFLTPIGYQTNMMVYGPGGYRFGDYVRLGAPLTALMILTVVSLVPWFWPF
jgi:di/tricarboxylate transporter